MAKINQDPGTAKFVEQAKQILKNIQSIKNKSDQINENKIRPVCTRFMDFYEYYEQELQNDSKRGFVQVHMKNLQTLDQIEKNYKNYTQLREQVDFHTEIVRRTEMTRQLEILLTAFKRVFLKMYNHDFIQTVVIESEGYEPIVIQINNDQGLANLIESQASDWQGKLKKNIDMYETYKAKGADGFLGNEKGVKQEYIDVYRESRERISIFYQKANKPAFGGQALLLYKPGGRWEKFYVTNLGDLKEGFLTLIYKEKKLGQNMEYNIQIFTKSIGEVDGVSGTLWQDIAFLNNLVSAKSGASATGSHKGLINLIKTISETGDLDQIGKIIAMDSAKSQQARNKLLDTKENREKIEKMLGDQCDKIIGELESELAKRVNLTK